MKLMFVYVMLFGTLLIGCLGAEVDPMSDELVMPVSRPPLSQICDFRCHNSHGWFQCTDDRASGEANVAIAPLLEGTTKVASTIWGTTSGWASTSCPNCQWQLQRITTTFLFGGTVPSVNSSAIDDVGISKNVNPRGYEWDGVVSLRIWDPTDASVGTCDLNVDVSLIGGQPI